MICNIKKTYTKGEGGTLIILASFANDSLSEAVFSYVNQKTSKDFYILVMETDNWDADLSPWPAAMPGSDRLFLGKGQETLAILQKKIEENQYNKKYEKIIIAGYSLAGLFALWAVHECDLFDGCICCSGSLWFDGWEEYSKMHMLKKPGSVYLSLGGKEEKAKDPIVATIGQKTKDQNNILDDDLMVTRHTLVMNPGGHFASPDKRLAQGIIWTLGEKYEKNYYTDSYCNNERISLWM